VIGKNLNAPHAGPVSQKEAGKAKGGEHDWLTSAGSIKS
jgi:hypothetical protein